MDIVQLGAQLLSDRLGVQIDTATVASALSKLLGDGQGNIDLAESVEGRALTNGGISADKIPGLLGENELADFASRVGTDTGTAAAGLAEVIPQLMDKASSGGSLRDAAGGLGGLMGAAKSFLS